MAGCLPAWRDACQPGSPATQCAPQPPPPSGQQQPAAAAEATRQVEAQGANRLLRGVQVAEQLCGGSLEHALLRVKGRGGAGGAAAAQGWYLHDLIFHLTGARISGLEDAAGEGGLAAAAVEARRDGMSWMHRADASLAVHTWAAAAAPTAVARAAAEQRVRDAQDELDQASLRWRTVDAHTPGWVKQLCEHDRVAADAARLPAAERLYGGPARGRPCRRLSSHCGSACVAWACGRRVTIAAEAAPCHALARREACCVHPCAACQRVQCRARPGRGVAAGGHALTGG